MAFYALRVLTFCMLTLIITKDRFNFVTVHFDLLLSPFSKSFRRQLKTFSAKYWWAGGSINGEIKIPISIIIVDLGEVFLLPH